MSKQSNSVIIPFSQPPLIVIGLGGSGDETVFAAKPALKKSLEAGLVHFLVQDNDPKGKDRHGKSFIDMILCSTGSLIQQIRQNPDSFPGYKHLGELLKLRKAES